MEERRMSILPKSLWLALTLMLTMASSALAQTAGSQGCTPQERSNPALQKQDQTNSGVICPPDIDLGMKAPTPKTDDPSVIAPPGAPGGDSSMRPR
jgi:hypothetical protein